MVRSFDVGEHFERFIDEQVESGRYNCASELVREAIGLIEDRETLRLLKAAEIRRLVEEARSDPRPPIDADAFFDEMQASFAVQDAMPAPHRRQSAE